MSNATQPSQSGDSRRRRSRGGKNRNRNNQHNHRGDRETQSNRSEEFRPKSPRPPRGGRKVELKWWQKLLKAIGLYNPPNAKSGPKQRESSPARSESQPKSNTRNARRQGEESTERPQRQNDRNAKRSRGGDPSTVESNRVYVGNLSYDVSEQDLQELFKGIGPVRNVEIVYNRTTHRSKGYGFVEMLQRDDTVRAVEVLHDQPFMGRNMIVSGAKSKEQEADDLEAEKNPVVARPVTLAPLPEFPHTEAIVATPAPEASAAPAADSDISNEPAKAADHS